MESRRKMKLGVSDRIILTVGYALLGLFVLIILVPLVYVVMASFMDPNVLNNQGLSFRMKDWTLDAYRRVLENEMIWRGFANSLFYSAAFTAISVFVTLLAAYPMSKKEFVGRQFFNAIFIITMFFGGGMIPSYLLVKNLGLLDTRWVLLLNGAVSVYNMIVMRTFFMTSIPEDLLEASKLDGCTDFQYLRKVVLPLSKSILAVIVMYYAVGHWNAYFNAFLYLSDDRLYPLQLFLRDILISNQVGAEMVDTYSENVGIEYVLKYALIVIATVPMVVIYPFVQKHFQKGVMIGAIKG